MSRAPVRIVVVGTGFGARVVAPVFEHTPGCEVVEVVSARDPVAIRAAVARRDIDLVSIHSPPFLHAEHVRAALGAGHHVLCDKPFARNGSEAAALLAEAEDAGVVHLLNFEFRFDPARIALRDLVADGSLGAVEHLGWTHCTAGARVPLRHYGWLFDAARGGGFVGAWGAHAVDTLRWLVGEVVSVAAVRRLSVPERPDAHGRLHRCTAEDGFSAVLGLAGGATAALDASFAAVAPLPPRIVVAGSAAVAELVADEEVRVRWSDGVRETVAVDRGEPADRHGAAMRRWSAVVRDAVRAGGVAPGTPTFVDGWACDRVLDELRAAPLVSRAG